MGVVFFLFFVFPKIVRLVRLGRLINHEGFFGLCELCVAAAFAGSLLPADKAAPSSGLTASNCRLALVHRTRLYLGCAGHRQQMVVTLCWLLKFVMKFLSL